MAPKQPEPGKSPPLAGQQGLSAPSHDLFGTSLEPSLLKACGNRISNLRWFRTDWQRGGAVTAYADWAEGDDPTQPVVIKLPVPPQELRWLTRLQVAEGALPIVPKIYAHGMELGGYDFAWVVMERLPVGPLDAAWGGNEFDLLIEAAGRFQAATAAYPVDRDPPDEHWPELLDRARKTLRECVLPEAQRWNGVLKIVKKKLKPMLARWHADDHPGWCHGDLHLANAMTHHPAPLGPAVLFDLARVHVGRWIEDAVYVEHLFWTVPHRLDGRDLVKNLSRERKRLDLPVESDWPRLANIRRVLLAVGNLAAQSRRPDPAQAEAGLLIVEKVLPSL
ncbi:MAG: aminoglycoside phosphotransferase family protein [Phycisphaeraceae bacterium]